MKKLPMLTKSFLGFSVFLAVPLIIAGFIFNYNMIRYSENEISKSSIINLQNVKKLNDLMVDSITKQSIRLSIDVILQDIGGITDFGKISGNVDDMLKLEKVYQILDQTKSYNFRVQSIYFYPEAANYVISTRHGFVLKSDFPDKAWIKQYEDSKNMGTGTIWLDSRPIDGIVRKPADNNNVLTFILPLKNLMVTYDGAIVVNVYERELYNLMNDTAYEKEGSVVIISNNGTVVSHYDKNLIGTNISNHPYIKEILDSKDTTGYFIDDSGADSRMYTYYKSEFNNWIYLGDISMKSLIAKTSVMRNGIIVLILILMLSGIVFSYFFSRNMYNPVKKLMADIQRRRGIDFKEKGNEMAVLSRVFDSLAKQEDNMANTLEKERHALKNKYITDMLKGDIEESDIYEQFKGEFPYKNYICALIGIDRNDIFSEKYTHEQQYYIKLLVLKACDEVTSESFKVTGILYEKNKIAVIVNSEFSDPATIRTALISGFGKLQSEVAKVLSNSITVGIGGCSDNTGDIPDSFSQAQEAFKYRIVKGNGSIIFYEDISKDDSEYFYPYQYEKHILNYLRLGSQEEITAEIAGMMKEIRERKDITLDNIIQIFIQLVGNTVKYLVDININIGNIFGADYNIYQKLSSKETLDEINTWLTGFYTGIIRYMSDISNENKSVSDLVLDYIHNNFRMNIDTTSIADSTGVSYSSVGRIVRNKTGKNVLEYVNGLRIEEAKRLLRQTNMNLRDIAANIGYNNDQSFMRFFKKYEGITPGEFRSLN